MWLPKWLGQSYCKLQAEFGAGEFQFEEALKVLHQTDGRLRVILSGLRRNGFLDVVAKKGRKRIYRLADPSEVTLSLGKGIDLQKVPEPARAALRSYLKGLFERYGKRVISIVLYGSFSRGGWEPESDIDLLLVIDGFNRDESLIFENTDKLVWMQWELNRNYHKVQPYCLTKEQASYHRPIYLDMTVEGMILYDEGGFVDGVFKEIRARLFELGAKRYRLPSGAWYWVLKPDLKLGEVVEI